jgi:hypothetical protein
MIFPVTTNNAGMLVVRSLMVIEETVPGLGVHLHVMIDPRRSKSAPPLPARCGPLLRSSRRQDMRRPTRYRLVGRLVRSRSHRERLIAAQLATEEEIEQHLSNVATGQLDLTTSPMVSAWVGSPVDRQAAARGRECPVSAPNEVVATTPRATQQSAAQGHGASPSGRSVALPNFAQRVRLAATTPRSRVLQLFECATCSEPRGSLPSTSP